MTGRELWESAEQKEISREWGVPHTPWDELGYEEQQLVEEVALSVDTGRDKDEHTS